MQIVYFPYLSMHDVSELNFGEFKVWNFDKKAEEYIPDKKLRSYISNLLKSNVKNETSLQGIGIFSIGSIDFREYTQEEFRVTQEARLLMFLSSISKTNVSMSGANSGHFLSTSENFTFVTQNFQLDGEYISEQNGYIVSRMDGGYRIGKMKFHAPSYLLNPMRFTLDSTLLTALLKTRKKQKRFYWKVLQATDLLFESYFNNPQLSLNARILLQVGAFEVLLDLPESGQRKKFKEIVEQLLVKGNDPQRTFYSERSGGRKELERNSIKVMWADKFYSLRNHVIHGEKVKANEFVFKHQRYVDIAPMFFVLFTKIYLNQKLKKIEFIDVIKWDKFSYNGVDSNFGFVYKDNSINLRLSRLRK